MSFVCSIVWTWCDKLTTTTIQILPAVWENTLVLKTVHLHQRTLNLKFSLLVSGWSCACGGRSPTTSSISDSSCWPLSGRVWPRVAAQWRTCTSGRWSASTWSGHSDRCDVRLWANVGEWCMESDVLLLHLVPARVRLYHIVHVVVVGAELPLLGTLEFGFTRTAGELDVEWLWLGLGLSCGAARRTPLRLDPRQEVDCEARRRQIQLP